MANGREFQLCKTEREYLYAMSRPAFVRGWRDYVNVAPIDHDDILRPLNDWPPTRRAGFYLPARAALRAEGARGQDRRTPSAALRGRPLHPLDLALGRRAGRLPLG